MASTYTRPNSPFIYVNFRDASGARKNQKTVFRKDNPGDKRQAELLARQLTNDEHRIRAERNCGSHWDDWVIAFLHSQYEASGTSTIDRYKRVWVRRLRPWLLGQGITVPSQFRPQHVDAYRNHQANAGQTHNGIIGDLKVLAVIMNRAVKLELIHVSPCLRMGLRKIRPQSKARWTDAEIQRVAKAFADAPTLPIWLRATFWLGLYQAARLRQCAVPLHDIDLDRGIIHYRRTKGDKPFSQPIDPRAIEHIRSIVAERRAGRHATLCDIPPFASVEWREFLDVLGLYHLCHHGLRKTWISRAASGGAITLEQAKRFVNHGSTSVHEQYIEMNATDIAHVPALQHLPSFDQTRRSGSCEP